MMPSTLHSIGPLPPTTERARCTQCQQLHSRWILRGSTDGYVCALCVLYRSPWGEMNQAAITAAITRLSEAKERPMEVVDGKLTSTPDADDVLGVLVLLDRAVSKVARK